MLCHAGKTWAEFEPRRRMRDNACSFEASVWAVLRSVLSIQLNGICLIIELDSSLTSSYFNVFGLQTDSAIGHFPSSLTSSYPRTNIVITSEANCGPLNRVPALEEEGEEGGVSQRAHNFRGPSPSPSFLPPPESLSELEMGLQH